MWVLTRLINDYNQDGEYFVAAWCQHPSKSGVFSILERYNYKGNFDLVYEGGGRQEHNGKLDYQWFKFRELFEGEIISEL